MQLCNYAGILKMFFKKTKNKKHTFLSSPVLFPLSVGFILRQELSFHAVMGCPGVNPTSSANFCEIK